MAAYSQDLRERVLKGCQQGEAVTAIAQRLEVSESWVHSVYKRFKETGERAARRVGGYRKSVLEPWKDTIWGWISEKSDLTLAEMTERLRENGVSVAESTLWYQLAHWRITYKKKPARARTTTTGCTN